MSDSGRVMGECQHGWSTDPRMAMYASCPHCEMAELKLQVARLTQERDAARAELNANEHLLDDTCHLLAAERERREKAEQLAIRMSIYAECHEDCPDDKCTCGMFAVRDAIRERCRELTNKQFPTGGKLPQDDASQTNVS